MDSGDYRHSSLDDGRAHAAKPHAEAPPASGADLSNLINEAAILTARRERETIDDQALTDALERITMGLTAAPLQAVVAEFNRTNRLQLVIAEPAIAAERRVSLKVEIEQGAR